MPPKPTPTYAQHHYLDHICQTFLWAWKGKLNSFMSIDWSLLWGSKWAWFWGNLWVSKAPQIEGWPVWKLTGTFWFLIIMEIEGEPARVGGNGGGIPPPKSTHLVMYELFETLMYCVPPNHSIPSSSMHIPKFDFCSIFRKFSKVCWKSFMNGLGR